MTSSRVDHARAFGRNAADYARLRPVYPDVVFDALLGALNGERRRAVDLGAGPGQATLKLADSFEQVTAVEPDARMLAEMPARGNVARLNTTAEAAQFGAGSLDAVVASTSFHWMDQALVTARAHDWLRPGGVFFPFMYGVFEFEGPAHDVFWRHAPLWAPYKDDRLIAMYDALPAVGASGLFAEVRPFSARAEKAFSPAEAAGLLATTSYASAYAQDNDGAEAYLERLSAEFSAAADRIVVGFPVIGAIAVKASAPAQHG
ncbi:MAG: class I SAM-dependent methyltransferase [Parvularculaceae bacterium]